jgi:hypothetical protein
VKALTKKQVSRMSGDRDGHNITPIVWHFYDGQPDKQALALAHQYDSISYYDSQGYLEEDNGCTTCGLLGAQWPCQPLRDLVEPMLTRDAEWIGSTLWRRRVPLEPPRPSPFKRLDPDSPVFLDSVIINFETRTITGGSVSNLDPDGWTVRP